MPELEAIRVALAELQDELVDQNDRLSEQNVLLREQNDKLESVERKLPTFVHKGRFRSVIAVVAIVGGLIGFIGWTDTRDADAERKRDIALAEENQRRDRVTGAARAYANCETTNRAFDGVDKGYIGLAQLSLTNARDDEHRARILESLRQLRSGLYRTDCTGHLTELSPEDAERVRAESSQTLPTIPLPPVPGLP